MTQYGYVRVSSRDQNVNRQLDALRAFPIKQEYIYIDRCTGATFERPRYQELTDVLAAGDLLVVTSIDRLGRNYEEILELGKKDMRYLVLLSYLDVLVDGRFLLSLRSIGINNRGSRNQLCIDVKKSHEEGKIVLDEKMMDMSFYEDDERDTF